VFAPYYHFGDAHLWRSQLAHRGSTFDRETGFQRLRDTRLAARVVHKRAGENELLSLLDLCSPWPLAGSLAAPRLVPDEDESSDLLREHPALQDGPFATIQLGSGNAIKDWPVERWGAVARHLLEQQGVRPVFIGQDNHSPVARGLIEHHQLSGAVDLCRGIPVRRLIALQSQAAVCVGLCSGPKHVTAALGRPTVTLYGPTDPVQWEPLFDRHLHAPVASPASELSAWELAGLPPNHAMAHITVEQVKDVIDRHLEVVGVTPGAQPAPNCFC
jgi:ADP-heptose:LPS heptosyltransferase